MTTISICSSIPLVPDVNECADNNGGCSQICINTNGNHQCSCEDGYLLNSDGRTCNGELLNL